MAAPAQLRPLALVDDDEDARFLFSRSCARAGLNFPMRALSSGNDALAYFGRCRAGIEPWPYVTFLDIKMPGLSGFDVLSWLADHKLLGETVVAMYSSSDDPSDIKRSFALGAHAYLRKNASDAQLAELVHGAVKLAS